MTPIRLLLGLACTFGPASTLAAQSAGNRFFGGLTVGLSTGAGGDFVERDNFRTIDLMLGRRVVAGPSSNWLVAGFVGNTWKGVNSLTCGPTYIGGPCAPHMPTFRFAGGMAGVEVRAKGTSIAVLAGPGLARSNGRTAQGETAFAVSGRVELAQTVGGRIALVLSNQNVLLPNAIGATLRFHTLAVGIRIH